MKLRRNYRDQETPSEQTPPLVKNRTLNREWPSTRSLLESAVVGALVTGLFSVLVSMQSSEKRCTPGEARGCRCGTVDGSQYCGASGETFGVCECAERVSSERFSSKQGNAEQTAFSTVPTSAMAPPVNDSGASASHRDEEVVFRPSEVVNQRSEPLAPSAGYRHLLTSFPEPVAFPIGRFITDCRLTARGLHLAVHLEQSQSQESYGGCCVEGAEPILLDDQVDLRSALRISHDERIVEVKVEHEDNRLQEYTHRGSVARGVHRVEGRIGEKVNAVKRFCVAIRGVGEPAHKTELEVAELAYRKAE